MGELTDILLQMNEIEEELADITQNRKHFKRVLTDRYQRKALANKVKYFINLRNRVKEEFMHASFIEEENEIAQQVLEKINEQLKFTADHLIENAFKTRLLSIHDRSNLDDDYLYLDEGALEEFYSFFNPYDYYKRLVDGGIVVTPVDIPGDIRILLDEARSCYGFKHFNAMTALCRSAIEMTLRDIGIKTGKVSEIRDTLVFYQEYPPSKLIHLVTKGDLQRKTKLIYGKLSEAIHGFKIVDADEAKNDLNRTLKIVSSLYQPQMISISKRKVVTDE